MALCSVCVASWRVTLGAGVAECRAGHAHDRAAATGRDPRGVACRAQFARAPQHCLSGLTPSRSGGFLQPHQPDLRHCVRLLRREGVPDHVRRHTVRGMHDIRCAYRITPDTSTTGPTATSIRSRPACPRQWCVCRPRSNRSFLAVHHAADGVGGKPHQ